MKNPLNDVFRDRLPGIIWFGLVLAILMLLGAIFIVFVIE